MQTFGKSQPTEGSNTMKGAIAGTARDHAATTHLEYYNAADVGYAKGVGGNLGIVPSGFSGSGWAVVDTATDEPLAYCAWRIEALQRQADIETDRNIERLQERNAHLSVTGKLTPEQRDELGDAYRARDRKS